MTGGSDQQKDTIGINAPPADIIERPNRRHAFYRIMFTQGFAFSTILNAKYSAWPATI